jgi:hypothetical protein
MTQRTMSRSNLQQPVVSFCLAVVAVLMVGCGARPPAEIPVPAGAAQGRSTFVYFYTDN